MRALLTLPRPRRSLTETPPNYPSRPKPQDAVKFVKDVYMATDPTNDLFNLMCLGGPADAYD